MRLYQLLNEVVGSTQKAIPFKDRSADEVYFFVPEKNQIRFTNKKGESQVIGPVSQIVQSKINPNIINAVIDYHYRHVNIGLDLKKSTTFLSRLPSAALPLKTALYDAKQKRFIVQSNEKRLKRPANSDLTDPAAIATHFTKRVIPTLKKNLKVIFKDIEPDVSKLVQNLKEFLYLEYKKRGKKPINEETYEYIASDPTTGKRRHDHIEADSEEEAIDILKRKKLRDIEITSEKETGYAEKPGFFGTIANMFKSTSARDLAYDNNMKLGRLQSNIITQAKNILMEIRAKLNVQALTNIYNKYKNANVPKYNLSELYSFIGELSEFEQILTEIAFLGQTEDKLKNTLSQKAGNTKAEKESFKNYQHDYSGFLKDTFQNMTQYANV